MPAISTIAISILAVAERPATLWLPRQSSTAAPAIDQMFDLINYICYFFFVLITVLLVYFAWKYRRSPENHAGNAQGPTHNTALELAWTALPLILVIVIFYKGFTGFVYLAVPPKNSYEIAVTAQQWAWDFKYPNGAQNDDLVVPAGVPVKLTMRSQDVIHSLYIPDFRVKQDVVPGRYSTMWFNAPNPTGEVSPTNTNAHWLFCTEYCGTSHSDMNRRVHVLEQANFDAWLAERSRWLDVIDAEDLWWKAGPKLFARCVQCHSLDGVDGNGPSWGPRAAAGLGPIWDRTTGLTTPFTDGKSLSDLIGAGKPYGTPEDYIRDSILNPGGHLVKGFTNAMPTFKGQLNDKAIDAIIGFMKHVDQFDPKTLKPKPGSEAAKLAGQGDDKAAPPK